jgi:predicted aldo/keto reductase-like oxidoreductase
LSVKEEGLIRHIGITSHNPNLVVDIIKDDFFETIMIPYNYITSQADVRLLSLARKENVGTIIMKPFAGGVLSNATAALKYVFRNGNVDTVIPGMIHPSEVDENLNICLGSHRLSDIDNELIVRDVNELGNKFCRWCDYCKICPQSIPISFIFRMERRFPDESSWTQNTRNVIEDAIRLADTCIDCGLCEQICPYKLAITEMIPEAVVSLNDQLSSFLSKKEIQGSS